jgi:uncharacterized membrane protein
MLKRFSGTISRAQQVVRRQIDRRPWLAIVLIVAVAFILFTFYSTERYFAFQTNYFDLGLYTNSIWRTIHNYESWSTLILPSTRGHIGHISPILGLVVLVYALVPDPRTLLVIQAAAIAFAAMPLYLIALRETRNQLLSISVAGLFLANPALHGIIRFDFHVESFIPLFVFLTYFAYPRQSPTLFYLSLGAMLSTIEYSAILGTGIALSLWFARKRLDRRIVATFLGSLMLLAIIALSTFGGAFESRNWPANWLAGQFVGSSPAFWSSPVIFLASLVYNIPAKISYILVATAPMWVALWKYSSRIIPAIPWMAVVIISSRYSYSNVNFQYSVFLVPFVYLASIPFLYAMMKHRRIILGLVAIALIVTFLYSALSPTASDWPAANPLASTVASISNGLPQNATILTESDLYPQLSNKAYVSLNYSSPEPPQYILINFDSPWYNWTSPGLGYPLSPREQTELLTNQYPYQLILQDRGLHLYKLGSGLPNSSHV